MARSHCERMFKVKMKTFHFGRRRPSPCSILGSGDGGGGLGLGRRVSCRRCRTS